MKTIFYISFIALTLTSSLYARGGGGHGGGGGGHAGGHGHGGGARRHGHGGGSHHGGGAHGHRGHGHWGHHSGHHGHGNWNERNWNGYNQRYWNGPYYYNGFGWYAGGAFLVGLTFYTCAELQNYNTWQINNDDVDTYNSWVKQGELGNLTVSESNDPNYKYFICNGTTCVKANPK